MTDRKRKKSFSAFRENGVYHTHMFQYQAIGTALGIATGIFIEFLFPGHGKVIGFLLTPISFHTARKLGLKAWQKLVRLDIKQGDYVFALQEINRLYHLRLGAIEKSELNETWKTTQKKVAFKEYVAEVNELTKPTFDSPDMSILEGKSTLQSERRMKTNGNDPEKKKLKRIIKG